MVDPFDSLDVAWRRDGLFRGVLVEDWATYPDALLGRLSGGAGRLEREGRAPVLLGDGEGYFVPPGTRYRFIQTSRRPASYRWAHLSARLLGTVDAWSLLDAGPALGADDGARIATLAEGFVAASANPDPLARAAERKRLAVSLFAVVAARSRAATGAAARLGAIARLRPALERMERDLAEPVGRGDLARLVGLSPTRFHAVFARALGCAPMAWLQRQRLRRAQELLIASERPIAEIATLVGIPDPFHFSRLFRRRLGESPTAYRLGRRRALEGASTPIAPDPVSG